MKQDKDWTDVMRNALRDAELPPPEHGWARLEAELRGVRPEASAGMAGTEGGRTTAARRPQWKIHVKRIAAAAAVVLLGVATVGFWLRPIGWCLLPMSCWPRFSRFRELRRMRCLKGTPGRIRRRRCGAVWRRPFRCQPGRVRLQGHNGMPQRSELPGTRRSPVWPLPR